MEILDVNCETTNNNYVMSGRIPIFYIMLSSLICTKVVNFLPTSKICNPIIQYDEPPLDGYYVPVVYLGSCLDPGI